MKEQPTRVVYRTWPKSEGGDVIALFPDLVEKPGVIQSYMHVGQHSGADVGIVYRTRPATEEEIVPLRQELTQIGYVLTERKRITRR